MRKLFVYWLLVCAALPVAGQSVFPFKREGLWGYRTARGDTLLPPTFAFADYFQHGLAQVNLGGTPLPNGGVRGGRWGVINDKGKWVIEPSFTALGPFQMGSAVFQRAGGFGIVADNGKEIVPAQYTGALPFAGDRAWVRVRRGEPGGWQLIDRKGARVKLFEAYEPVAAEQRPGAYVIRTRVQGKWLFGLLDEAGYERIPPAYDSLRFITDALLAFLGPAADVNTWPKPLKWGLVAASGVEVARAIYDDIGAFSEGLIRVDRAGQSAFLDTEGRMQRLPSERALDYANGRVAFQAGTKWGYKNGKGEIVLEARYDTLGAWQGEYGFARMGEKWGILDAAGAWRVTPTYRRLVALNRALVLAYRETELLATPVPVGRWGAITPDGQPVLPFRYVKLQPVGGGLEGTVSEALFGFIDTTGTYRIEPAFEAAAPFREGRALVQQNFQLRFIDPAGKTLTMPNFERAEAFSEGRASVRLNGRWGFLDTTGSVAIPTQFEAVGAFRGGLAPVKIDGLWGFIRLAGTYAIPPQFQSARTFSEGKAAVQLGDRWGYIDRQGRWVVEPRYTVVGDFHNGRALVSTYGDYAGYIDPNGRKVLHEVFQLAGAQDFSEGFVWVRKPGEHWFAANRSGLRMTTWGKYPAAAPFSEGKAAVLVTAGAYSLLSRNGQLLFEPQPLGLQAGEAAGQIVQAQRLENGRMPRYQNGLWGFVGPDGNWVIPPKFQAVGPFNHGLAPALSTESGRKIGFYTAEGIELYPPTR